MLKRLKKQEATEAQSELAVVGRQPIFKSDMEVYGYELLFRHQQIDISMCGEDQATASVLLSALTDVGLGLIANGKLAFVNITQNLLLNRDLFCLPAKSVVLEILENVQPSPAVLSVVRKLVQEGFTIALDDFVYRPELDELIRLSHIVKLEFPLLPREQVTEQIAVLRKLGVPLILAEKIETQEEFEFCKKAGCDLFQGFFFCRPQLVNHRRIPNNIRTAIRLMCELQRADITTADVEELISADPHLSYKFFAT
jgi:c-di-GMP phosphodiesterase